MFLSSGVTITTIQLSTIIAIICMVVPLSTKKNGCTLVMKCGRYVYKSENAACDIEFTKTSITVASPPSTIEEKAIAILKGEQDGQPIRGILFLVQNCRGSIHVTGNITGLPSTGNFSKHGLHIHEHAVTDITDNVSQCVSAGAHFNPKNVSHADISSTIRHAGDWGNVLADQNGFINVDIVDSVNQLYGPSGIIGRTIVLHKNQDDLGLGNNTASKATGNSGPRIACGIIGIL